MKRTLKHTLKYESGGLRDARFLRNLQERLSLTDLKMPRTGSGSRQDVFHVEEYGVTLRFLYSSVSNSISLYGAEEKVGEVEGIINEVLGNPS